MKEIVKPVHDPSSHPEMTEKEYSAHHRRKYQEWWRATHACKPRKTVAVPANGTDASPVKLAECPCCGARFFAVKGSS